MHEPCINVLTGQPADSSSDDYASQINVPFKVKCCPSFIILGSLNVKERTDEVSGCVFFTARFKNSNYNVHYLYMHKKITWVTFAL